MGEKHNFFSTIFNIALAFYASAETMLGAFRSTTQAMSGLLWKRSWRLSPAQKYRQRKRMQLVDSNVNNLFEGLKTFGQQTKRITNYMENVPKESEMLPKDKYTVFNKHSRGYRKSVHHVPKWTKLSFRENPDNF